MVEQLCLFDIVDFHDEILVGDYIKVILPDVTICSETHYYLLHYFPCLINKIGQVRTVINGGYEISIQNQIITLANCAVQYVIKEETYD